MDAAGNAVITDFGSTSARIRVVAATTGTFSGQAMTTGDIYTRGRDGGHADQGGELPRSVVVAPSGKTAFVANGATPR